MSKLGIVALPFVIPPQLSRHYAIALAAAVFLACIRGPAIAGGDAGAGAKLFASSCARCHGKEAKGNGPDLVKLQSAVSPDDWTDRASNQQLSDSFIISMITKGGKANGKSRIMPAFGDKLSAAQMADLLAFIRSLPK